ncbi:MAG: hypothetical protein IPJ01_11775 [Micavibrio sp.]|nr:hypothetical protein [Micavibrio sp.]
MSEPKRILYDIKDFNSTRIKYAKDGGIYVLMYDANGAFVLEKSDDFVRKFSIDNYINIFRQLSINDKGNVRV